MALQVLLEIMVKMVNPVLLGQRVLLGRPGFAVLMVLLDLLDLLVAQDPRDQQGSKVYVDLSAQPDQAAAQQDRLAQFQL